MSRSSSRPLNKLRALVTGATGGMGEAIVNSFVRAGIRTVAAGKDARRLADLKREYPEIVTEAADLSRSSETEKLALNALTHYNGLDVLINNAGVGITKNVLDLELTEYEDMMNINLKAVFILSQIIGRAMIKQGYGHIINIGSGASTTPIAGMAVYCASKHGLLGFSESLGLELRKHGVKVTIIMPGSTATRFGGSDPEKRLKAKPGILLPEDVVDTIMYALNQSERAWSSQINLRPLDPDKDYHD